MSQFKVGDRVVNKYGQHGTVQEFQNEFIRVLVDGTQFPGGWYESSLRFETPPQAPAPVNPETKLGYTVGQRVEILNSAYHGGRFGVVTGFIGGYSANGEPSFVKVITDLGKIGGWLPSSIKLVAPVAPIATPVPPPALTPNQGLAAAREIAAGVSAKYAGQNAAINKNAQVYQIAKNIAIQLGKDKGLVTIDAVQGELVNLGYKAADLGNAAGAVFRGKNWKEAGPYLSRRESNHARKITVWKYVGAS
jgi:hypothetical protein